MPANVESMFSVREKPWHGMGTVLTDYPGRDKAMELAGHNFVVKENEVFANVGNGKEKLEGFKVLYRADNKHILNVVRDSYSIIQNAVLWDIVDALVQQPNVKYETAGVLKEGAVLWVLAKLDEPVQIKGDNSAIYPYVMASTAHDGTGATRSDCIDVRVVCWNTYNAAIAQTKETGLSYTFRHTKKVMERIESAREALGLARKQHEAFLHLAEELAEVPVTESGVKDFLRTFLPEPPANVITDRVRGNIEEAREKVRVILEGLTVPVAHKRTAYGLFLAGTEYLDHVRRYNSEETYFNRTMLSQFETKRQVAKLALAVH